MMLSLLAVALQLGVALAQSSTAQRPSNATICDWYAIQRYGQNTTESQGKLMQSVVALAFAGRGSNTKFNPEVTGILNPGVFENTPVNLLPWFNGSIDSTNLNNLPVGINWLDGGGTVPLYAFLNGEAQNVTIPEGTNEFRLFGHFFRAFAFVFGCTQPPPRLKGETGTPLSLAYVHKFMNLNHTHLGHFINQLTLSAVEFGFSVQDSNTLESQMNARYNVRCAPGITLNPAQGPQLFSLCQAETCPLAAPVSDCDSYVDLGPNGSTRNNAGSSASSSPSPTGQSPGSTATVTTTPTASPSSSASSASAPVLGAGPIAGIAIGGAALLFGFIALLVFLLRKRRSDNHQPDFHPGFGGPPSNPSYVTSPYPPTSPYQTYAPSNAHTDAHTSYMSNPNPNPGELWTPPPVEIGGGGDEGHGYGGMHKNPEMTKSKVL